MNGFILIWRVRFLFENDFGIFIKKVPIIKTDMADNPQTIGDDAKVIGIAEMAVNIELFNVGVGGGMGRHGDISSFIRAVTVIEMHSFCHASIPEESKMVIFALQESMAWQIGSVRSTSRSKTAWISSRKSCLNRVILEVFETLSKLQNSR